MRKIYKTDIERIMNKGLKDEGIKFVHNYPIRCKYGYIIDFAIPEEKLVIECDGEVWHPIGNKRDKTRDIVLKQRGWTTLRFRGKEIKNNLYSCLNKIKQEIKSLQGGKNGKQKN